MGCVDGPGAGVLLAAAPAGGMEAAARSVAEDKTGKGGGACERACSLCCGGATAGAARARGWGTAAAAVTGCTCGGECGEGDGTAAGLDWRRVYTAGSTAAVKALNGCKLVSRAAGESENSMMAACCDRSRDAATAFAASVSCEGWPNGAGEALCGEVDGAEPENWPCEPDVSERLRPGGGRVVDSAVRMWGMCCLAGGERKARVPKRERRRCRWSASIVRRAGLRSGAPRSAKVACRSSRVLLVASST